MNPDSIHVSKTEYRIQYLISSFLESNEIEIYYTKIYYRLISWPPYVSYEYRRIELESKDI